MDKTSPVSSLDWLQLQKWLWLGLLIRLLVMPFTAHGDLLIVYERAYLWLTGNPVKGLGPNLFNMVHAGFLWLLQPLIAPSSIWKQTQNAYTIDWLGFVNSTAIYRQLFLFKVPYLIFEVLAVWMLLKIVKPEMRVKTVIFWVVNPVIIFSTYVFGRFDIIIIFLMLAAIYLAQQQRFGWALMVLGVAAMLRVYPMILIPIFVLTLAGRPLERWRLAIIGGLPFFGSVLFGAWQGDGLVRDFAGMQHLSYPLTMKFSLLSKDNIYVFVFLYSLLILFLYVRPDLGIEKLKMYCLFVLLLFFSTSFFHPHYFTWAIPFIAFFIDQPQVVAVHRLQILGWIVYTFQWGRSLASYLIASLSPAFFWSVISPAEFIDKYYPADQFIGIARSFFSAACLVVAYLVWRRSKADEELPLVADIADKAPAS